MKILFFSLAMGLSALTVSESLNAQNKSEYNGDSVKCILNGKTPTDQRYKTFAHALKLMRERNLEIFVETATKRVHSENRNSDECFTLILADWIRRNQGQLDSIKFDEGKLQNVKNALGKNAQFIKIVNGNSIDTLKKFGQKIDFIYVDSMDFDERNAKRVQEQALKEIQAAYQWLTPNSIVMVDGCKFGKCGKGALVIDFLHQCGWKTIFVDESQVILSREQLNLLYLQSLAFLKNKFLYSFVRSSAITYFLDSKLTEPRS